MDSNASFQIQKFTTLNSNSPCWWRQISMLLLGEVQGNAICVWSLAYDPNSIPYCDLCLSQIVIPNVTYPPSQHLEAPKGSWFTCTSGLTPCVMLDIFTMKTELYILVHMFPQVYWYSGTHGWEHLNLESDFPQWLWAAPVLIPILMGLGLFGATALGTTSLIIGDKNYQELSALR